jgi:hypothetical protein
MVQRVPEPWSAAALPEIMAGAVQESKLDVPLTFGACQDSCRLNHAAFA